jgi:hypothetical protein
MRLKIRKKTDIKLKDNSMNIITYWTRHKEHVIPPEAVPRVVW